jgi:PilZ domain-containing protein
MMDDERRRHPRVRLDGRAAGQATVFAEFVVTSLTENGAQVEMEMPLALGSACDLTFNLEQGQVDVKGVVAGVEKGAAGYRTSLDFLSVDEADQPALQSFLAQERERA